MKPIGSMSYQPQWFSFPITLYLLLLTNYSCLSELLLESPVGKNNNSLSNGGYWRRGFGKVFEFSCPDYKCGSAGLLGQRSVLAAAPALPLRPQTRPPTLLIQLVAMFQPIHSLPVLRPGREEERMEWVCEKECRGTGLRFYCINRFAIRNSN